LTSFIGGDPVSKGTTRSTNSTFVAVLNMPLPSTKITITTDNIFEWQRSPTVKVKFQSSPATYPVAANHSPLPLNGFSPAPIQSITYGTNQASAGVPDTTFPVKNDVVLPNGTCPNAPGGTFTPPTQTLGPLTEGRYILHYFATDCASTEELRFIRNASPTANWASFKTEQINIDGTAPSITASAVTFAGGARTNTVTITLNCMDPVLSGDHTPGSGVVLCGPSLWFAVANTGSFKVTIPVGRTAHGTIPLFTLDLAGNIRTTSVSY
jgi:hypothetical protein